ncbi:MAG: translation elongation factor Ts [Candidatus Rariloculaceae bacterium]
MAIEAALVKELRERTSAGMMDCKRALVEAGGDIEQASDILRKSGQSKADKKASRVAAEGQVLIKASADGTRHVVIEVNSETDFVAKDENFVAFADAVAEAALAGSFDDVDALMASDAGGETLETRRQELVAKVGENIAVRRFRILDSGETVGSYSHMGRIGVLVELRGGDQELAKDLAMQVAATSPGYVSADDVPEAELAKEREILSAQALQEGKPEEIVQMMVEGRLRKHLDETTLTGQPFVKDPDTKVLALLASRDASALSFVRFEVGEGIEKKEDNFVQEVMAQATQSR